jgi:hypothetical protein
VKPKVYLETTIVSYLTARPSRDPVLNGMLEQTKKWWSEERSGFELIVSDVVVREASAGDSGAAQRRLGTLRGLTVVAADAEAKALAAVLLNNMALPANAVDDAAHIAIAAVNQLDYLLTWNCRHIANASMRPKLEGLCLAEGYRCPIICTPHELRKPEHEN